MHKGINHQDLVTTSAFDRCEHDLNQLEVILREGKISADELNYCYIALYGRDRVFSRAAELLAKHGHHYENFSDPDWIWQDSPQIGSHITGIFVGDIVDVYNVDRHTGTDIFFKTCTVLTVEESFFTVDFEDVQFAQDARFFSHNGIFVDRGLAKMIELSQIPAGQVLCYKPYFSGREARLHQKV